MLVEDAAPESLNGHVEDVSCDSEDEDQSQGAADPSHGRVCDDRDRGDAEGDGNNKAATFTHKIALLFLEGAQLARIGDRVADVAQRVEQFLGTRGRRIVLDERLLVREAHRYLIDAGQTAERLFDGARAQRAMKTADPCPDPCPAGSI